jgi:glycosyltransferase involved in cell wall biosynthesis
MSAPRSPKILFISAFSAPFIQEDLNFLGRYFPVTEKIGSGFLQIIRILLSCFKTDIAFCWFASVYAFVTVVMMKILRRKSVIILGGVDVSKEKELNYGIWLSPWKAVCVRFALRHASVILPVDESLAASARELAEYDGQNIMVLPTGYDAHFWLPQGRKEQIILTVAVVKDKIQLQVKGLDILIEAARSLPDKNICVVGTDRSHVVHLNPPPNIDFIPYVQRESLLPYYQRARVYCQPSRREGLSNALCEAMLCECIPVATNVGGTAGVIGFTGILVSPKSAESLANALRHAFSLPEENGREARERISKIFTKERRQEVLLQVLQSSDV